MFHENAKREIADTYANVGETERACKLYEGYLASDPLWGWGWIGYYRLLKDQKNLCYIDIMKDLYADLKPVKGIVTWKIYVENCQRNLMN